MVGWLGCLVVVLVYLIEVGYLLLWFWFGYFGWLLYISLGLWLPDLFVYLLVDCLGLFGSHWLAGVGFVVLWCLVLFDAVSLFVLFGYWLFDFAFGIVIDLVFDLLFVFVFVLVWVDYFVCLGLFAAWFVGLFGLFALLVDLVSWSSVDSWCFVGFVVFCLIVLPVALHLLIVDIYHSFWYLATISCYVSWCFCIGFDCFDYSWCV